MRMVVKVRIMTRRTVTARSTEQWCQGRSRLHGAERCMTVCTGTAVIACKVVMDLAATDKRSGDRIRCSAAAYCIMTAVTRRISVGYRYTMVYCGRCIRMDSFPGIRRWIMTRRTRYCGPGSTSCCSVCLGRVTVYTIGRRTELLVITGGWSTMTRCTGVIVDIRYYIGTAMAVYAVTIPNEVIRRMRVAMFC